MEELEKHADLAKSWFQCYFMKLNTDKCHLLVPGHKFEEMFLKLDKDLVWKNKAVKLLVITIDSYLKFDQHMSESK